MIGKVFDRVSAQRKNINTSRRFGNRGILKQQGTTRIIYDTLPHDGRLDYRFFEGVGTRGFIDTNLAVNQLLVGESMTMERVYLMVFTNIAGVPSTLLPINTSPDFLGGTFEFRQANVDIVKPIPILSFNSDFNQTAEFNSYTNFEFDTQLVIQPLLEFVATVRLGDSVTVANQFIRLVIEGAGSILAPRNTF